MPPTRYQRLAVISVFILLVLLSMFPFQFVTAAPAADLFISEYIEGSSNNKAIEIFNGTGTTIDLAANAYSLQYFFNGSISPGLTINLTGSIVPGDVHIVAHSIANAAILALADQTNSSGWYNGDDAVVLRRGTTVIDSVGQIGVDPGAEWGAGLTSTADNTLRRKASLCGGDANATDAFDPATEWDGFATDTASGLGSHISACDTPDTPPYVASTQPPDGATGVGASSSITVNFSEPVDVTASAVTLTCEGSPVSFSGLPANDVSSVSLDPAADLPDAATCTVTISASQVTDNDGTPDAMSSDYSFSFTVAAGPTRIHAIQGSGSASPLAGSVVSIRGVVVGDYQATNELRGFFVQEETGDEDGNPATSEGIFVFSTQAVAEGDLVTVTGRVDEFFGMTQLASVSSIVISSGGNLGLVTPATVDLPIPASYATRDAFWEQYEGMLVAFADTLTVTEYFELARYGTVQLVEGSRPYQFTQVNAPDAAAFAAYQDAIERRWITLDDFNNQQNRTDVIYHPQPGGFSPSNYFRGGDTLSSLTGIINYAFDTWRIEPRQSVPATFTPTNPRTGAPALEGSLRVASFNVLNYFNGPDFPTSRGADSPAEFAVQRDKIIAAITALDADVVGLLEIENDGGSGQAVEDLVNGLNAAQSDPADHYAYIDTGVVGTDEIKVALIYRPAAVTPLGAYAILDSTVDPDFDTSLNRPALAQTFQQPNGARFTVAVNHLKSKGSGCGAGDDDPIQGNCNGTRTRAAHALAAWLASDPTGSGDTDVMIMGDLNAYALEDPITALTGSGYVNLLGTNVYSYVFDGQLGNLDHALATQSLSDQVAQATIWHINADEVSVLDYNDTMRDSSEQSFEQKPYPLTAEGPYRSSDHDPVVVDLDLTPPPDLVLTKDDGGVDTPQGERLIYTLTYTNVGLHDASGVTLVETVPDYTFFDPRRSTAGWSCAPNNDAGATCTLLLGNLPAGASGTATFAVKVIDRVPRDVTEISNTARITDDGAYGPDPSPENNSATDTTPIFRPGRGVGSGPTHNARSIEAESTGVVRVGDWAEMNRPRGASGNAYVVNTSANAILVLPFSGTQVDIVYVKGPAFGRFSLVIDGATVQTVNAQAGTVSFGERLTLSGLAEGAHELRVMPESGQVIALDAFAVTASLEPVAPPVETQVAIPAEPVIVVTELPVLPAEDAATEPPVVTEAPPAPEPVSLPVMAAMDDGAPGWTSLSGWTLSPEGAYGDSGLGWRVQAAAESFDVLVWQQPLDLRNAQSPQLTFQSWSLASASSPALQVQGASGQWDTLRLSPAQGEWQEVVVDLSAYRGQVIQIRFAWAAVPAAGGVDEWRVDNVALQEAPVTIPPEPPLQPGETGVPDVTEPEVTLTPEETPVPTVTEPEATPTPEVTPFPTETPVESVDPEVVPTETTGAENEPEANEVQPTAEATDEVSEPEATEQAGS